MTVPPTALSTSPVPATNASTDTSRLANAIRALAMDAVQAANSGHPGMPMGMADIAEVLWNDFLATIPANPKWFNRDRFVLSNGHGSMLLYALLHLTGYDLPMDELKRFPPVAFEDGGPSRSRAITPAIETTTGPLGPGPRQCGRHGARRKIARGAIQPSRVRHRRSLHLRVHGRRLPDGRHLA